MLASSPADRTLNVVASHSTPIGVTVGNLRPGSAEIGPSQINLPSYMTNDFRSIAPLANLESTMLTSLPDQEKLDQEQIVLSQQKHPSKPDGVAASAATVAQFDKIDPLLVASIMYLQRPLSAPRVATEAAEVTSSFKMQNDATTVQEASSQIGGAPTTLDCVSSLLPARVMIQKSQKQPPRQLHELPLVNPADIGHGEKNAVPDQWRQPLELQQPQQQQYCVHETQPVAPPLELISTEENKFSNALTARRLTLHDHSHTRTSEQKKLQHAILGAVPNAISVASLSPLPSSSRHEQQSATLPSLDFFSGGDKGAKRSIQELSLNVDEQPPSVYAKLTVAF